MKRYAWTVLLYLTVSKFAAGHDVPSLPQDGMMDAKCSAGVNGSPGAYKIAYGQGILYKSHIEHGFNRTELKLVNQNVSYVFNDATKKWKPTGGILQNKSRDLSVPVTFYEKGGRLYFQQNSIIGIDVNDMMMRQARGDHKSILETENYINLEVHGRDQRCLNYVTWSRRSTTPHRCDVEDPRPDLCPYRPLLRRTDCDGVTMVTCSYQNVQRCDPNMCKVPPSDTVELARPDDNRTVEAKECEKVAEYPPQSHNSDQSDNAVSSDFYPVAYGLLIVVLIVVVIVFLILLVIVLVIVVLIFKGFVDSTRFPIFLRLTPNLCYGKTGRSTVLNRRHAPGNRG